MKKILIYYSHRQSLGHTSRILNLTKSFLKNYYKTKIYIFNGGLSQNYFSFPRDVCLMNLPYPYHNKTNFKQKEWSISSDTINLRLKFMLDNIKNIKPDIFITEFFPFGRPECIPELLPVLRFLKSKKTLIFSSIGYPYINPFFLKENQKLFFLLVKFFDRLFIHTPFKLEDRYLKESIKDEGLMKTYCQLFSLIENKITYTGYIIPEDIDRTENILKEFRQKNRKLILVSRGGGVVYPKIITSAILANKKLDRNVTFLIVPGPSSGKEELKIFSQLINKDKTGNIFFRPYLPQLYRYMRHCDLSINMAGYNTSVELLYFKKKCIVIPWESKNSEYFNDQLNRAYLLKNYLGAGIIPYKKITPENLKEAVCEQLENKLPDIRTEENFFIGAQTTVKEIMNY